MSFSGYICVLAHITFYMQISKHYFFFLVILFAVYSVKAANVNKLQMLSFQI